MKNSIACLILFFSAASAASALDHFFVLRVSTPMILSGAAGLRFGEPTGLLRPAIQAEAGIGGGKIAVGLDKTGETGFGYAIKAALYRSWLEPIEIDEDQDFIGLEVELSIRRLIMNVGGYRRVSSGEDDWLAAAGLGFLF